MMPVVPAVVVWQQPVQPVLPELVYKFVYHRLGYIIFLYLWRHAKSACEVSYGERHRTPCALHGHWEVSNLAADGLPGDMIITFHYQAAVLKPWYTKHFARQPDSQSWTLPNAPPNQAVVLVIAQ